jgi:hypothetical protein
MNIWKKILLLKMIRSLRIWPMKFMRKIPLALVGARIGSTEIVPMSGGLDVGHKVFRAKKDSAAVNSLRA